MVNGGGSITSDSPIPVSCAPFMRGPFYKMVLLPEIPREIEANRVTFEGAAAISL